jgi:disulfide bond formation protein DsbB
LFTQYLYFFAVGLLFGIIFLIGWLGFTLSFLILLILYSTLVVVFWSFFIAFEESGHKKEKTKTSLYLFPLSFVLFLPTELWLPLTLKPFEQLYQLDFFQTGDPNEFFFFFLIVYVFNPLTFLFVFITLVIICFNIVSLFLIKQKMTGLSNLSLVSFAGATKATSLPFKTGRTGFWTTISSNLQTATLNKTAV